MKTEKYLKNDQNVNFDQKNVIFTEIFQKWPKMLKFLKIKKNLKNSKKYCFLKFYFYISHLYGATIIF